MNGKDIPNPVYEDVGEKNKKADTTHKRGHNATHGDKAKDLSHYTLVVTGNNGTTESDVSEQLSLQKRLDDHFSDPFTRVFRAWDPENKGRIFRKFVSNIPYRFLIVAFKWVFVTWQLVAFANERSSFATYLDRNNVAMRNLLLKDWITFYETMPYPPATGAYAIYRIEDLISHINHTLQKVNTIPTTATGSFFVAGNKTSTPIQICIKYFKKGVFDEENLDLEIDEDIKTDCNNYDNSVTKDFGFRPTIKELMESNNGNLVRLLIQVKILFSVISVHVMLEEGSHRAECYRIDTEVQYDNGDINGQILINFDTRVQGLRCREKHNTTGVRGESIFISIMVMILCLGSLGTGIKSFLKSMMLCLDTGRLFKKFGMDLKCRGRYQIFKVKNIIIIISDVITVTGTVIKVLLESRGTDSSDVKYDACAILLGIGCFFTWLGILHYLSYDKLFSLLFDVIEKSSMTVLRFLVVAALLFVGFVLCGWAVMGPHHIKFETITKTSQNLLALLNGDEIYVTLQAIANTSSIAYYFNGLFITTYVVIYTLIALNIFIAIFNTSYEHVRNYTMRNPESSRQSDLETFLGREEGESLFQCKRDLAAKHCKDCETPCCS